MTIVTLRPSASGTTGGRNDFLYRFDLLLPIDCELLVTATGLSVPGPVVGMFLLFTGVFLHGSIPDDLATVADSLLTHLSLLFVPAGAGILLHSRLLANELIPITVSLVVSTILTIGVTGILMAWLGPMLCRESRYYGWGR